MKNLEQRNLKIGIAGIGTVGSALQKYFEKQGYELRLYDKDKVLGSIEELNEADIIFICVPTPYDEKIGFNLLYVEEVCEGLSEEKIVVIKSTVLPGITRILQVTYLQHQFLFNPEFLREDMSNTDMENPGRQIIGYTTQSYQIARGILDLLPRAPFEEVVTSIEAEMIKYFGNTFLATKVIFANQMYELCKRLDIDYEIVRRCVSADERIGPSHLNIYWDGYRGYRGKCFPKDMKALIQFADKKGVDLKLHKIVEEINEKLIGRQEMKETPNGYELTMELGQKFWFECPICEGEMRVRMKDDGIEAKCQSCDTIWRGRNLQEIIRQENDRRM